MKRGIKFAGIGSIQSSMVRFSLSREFYLDTMKRDTLRDRRTVLVKGNDDGGARFLAGVARI